MPSQDKITKTDQTFQAIKDKAQQYSYGEWPIKLYIHKGEIQGFDEIEPAKIKFRAQ